MISISDINAMQAVFNWFRDECFDHDILLNDAEWKLYYHHEGVPNQLDGDLCGLWSVAFIYCVLRGIEFKKINSQLFHKYSQKSIFALHYSWWRRAYLVGKNNQKFVPLDISQVTKDPKYLFKQYNIHWDGYLTKTPVQNEAPKDLNGTKKSGDIWQYHNCCAASPSCAEKDVSLSRDLRCIVCGFTVHLKCCFQTNRKKT